MVPIKLTLFFLCNLESFAIKCRYKVEILRILDILVLYTKKDIQEIKHSIGL